MSGEMSWTVLSAGAQALMLTGGRQLRLLSAREVLEARREGDLLAQSRGETALCRNAALLARALEGAHGPLFADGGVVLDALTPREIGTLSKIWSDFDREENPGPDCGEEAVQQLKKVWSTRRRNGCAGACSAPSACCPPRNGHAG